MLRDAVSTWALNAIVGPTEHAISRDPATLAVPFKEWPSVIVSPGIADMVCHLYDYFRATSAIAQIPRLAQRAADAIDLNAMPSSWQLPVSVEVGMPERTVGGICVRGQTLRHSMKLGIEVKKLRMAIGDFRRGAFVTFPFEKVRAFETPLGLMWRDSKRWSEGHTAMVDFKSGREVDVDLAALVPGRRASGKRSRG